LIYFLAGNLVNPADSIELPSLCAQWHASACEHALLEDPVFLELPFERFLLWL